jgi:hypothetical protein
VLINYLIYLSLDYGKREIIIMKGKVFTFQKTYRDRRGIARARGIVLIVLM